MFCVANEFSIKLHFYSLPLKFLFSYDHFESKTLIFRLSYRKLKTLLGVINQIIAPSSVTEEDIYFLFFFQSELAKKKGDFVFQTGHVIEIVTKMFLVIQNATSKAPEIQITPE